MAYKAHIGVSLTDVRVTCMTYGDRAPIFDVVTASAFVTFTAPDRESLTADDVVAARDLARAAAAYAVEMDRVYALNQPVPFVPVAVGGER